MTSSMTRPLSQPTTEGGSHHNTENSHELAGVVDVSQEYHLVSKQNTSHDVPADIGNGVVVSNGSLDTNLDSLAERSNSTVLNAKTSGNVPIEVGDVVALSQEPTAVLPDRPKMNSGVKTSTGIIVASTENAPRNGTTTVKESALRHGSSTIQGHTTVLPSVIQCHTTVLPSVLQGHTEKIPAVNTLYGLNVAPDSSATRKVAFEIGKQLGSSTKKILIISAGLNPTVCETTPAKPASGAHVLHSDVPTVDCAPNFSSNTLDFGKDSPSDTVSAEMPPSTLSTNAVKKPVPIIEATANVYQTASKTPMSLVGSRVSTEAKSPALKVSSGIKSVTSNGPDVEKSKSMSSPTSVIYTDKIRLPTAGDASPLKSLKGSSKNSLLYKQLMSKANNKRFVGACNIGLQSVATFTKINAPSNEGVGETDSNDVLTESKTGCDNTSQTNLGLLAKINTLQSMHSTVSFSTGSKISVPYVVNSANSNVIFSYANSVGNESGDIQSAPDTIAVPNTNFLPTTVNNGAMVHSNGRAIYTVANNMISANPTKIALIGNNALKIAASTNSYTGLNIVRSTNIPPCTYTLANSSSIASFPSVMPPVNSSNRPMILIRTNPMPGAYLVANPGARLALAGKKVSLDHPVPAKEILSSNASGNHVICETKEVSNSYQIAQPNENYTKRIGVWKNNKINRARKTIGPKMATMKTYISNKTISICKPSAIENVIVAPKKKVCVPVIMDAINLIDVGNTSGMTENFSSTTRYINKSPKRRKICSKIKTLGTVTNICVKSQDRVVTNGSQRNRLLLPAGNAHQTPFVVPGVPNLVVPTAKQTMSETSRYFANFSTDLPTSQTPIDNKLLVAHLGNNIKETTDKLEMLQHISQNDTENVMSRPMKIKAARKQSLDIKTDPVDEKSATFGEPNGDDNKTLLRCETCPKTYSRKDSLAKHMAKTHSPDKLSSQ